MIYLLDTNVICEATAKFPNPDVLAWSQSNADECGVSCMTVGEIRKGIHLLPDGKPKHGISQWAEGIETDFAERVMPLNTAVLKVWGKLYAKHESKGFNMGVIDSLLAATALVYDLIIVTRNTGDFPREVKTLNPWKI